MQPLRAGGVPDSMVMGPGVGATSPTGRPSTGVSQTALGPTWANSGSLNINIDDLSLGGKPARGPLPSMNQLASTPTSPARAAQFK